MIRNPSARAWAIVVGIGATATACGARPAGTTSPGASGASGASAATAADDARGLAAFDEALRAATLAMDDAALLALWEDDGTSLLPETPPLAGKPAIAAMLAQVHTALPGATMTSFELACQGAEVHGDWASEWCTEHQVVALGGGQPPFDGRGVLLLVLHRGADGRWRLRREMWNQAPK